MRHFRHGFGTSLAALLLAACGSDAPSGGTGGQGTTSASTSAGTGGSMAMCPDGGAVAQGVPHVVIVIQENHTFDAYFGRYCTAAPGSNPTCTSGPACCEAAPAMDPSGASPLTLDDAQNGAYDPNHMQVCEESEIDDGMMDHYVTNSDPSAPSQCADARNFAIAPPSAVKTYHDLAAANALADRYFQPIAGQSSSNNMYLAVAHEEFIDNDFKPNAIGTDCDITAAKKTYTETTIADLLKAAGKTVGWYAEGYALAVKAGSDCPDAPKECGFHTSVYPCIYDPSDVPFLYYAQFANDTSFMRDYAQFAKDIDAGTLPDVTYVKALGYHTEHPGYSTNISDGMAFVKNLVNVIDKSCYKDSTLILVTWDEGGGFFDHVAPPADSTVDQQPYGTRVPLLALGRYAKKGEVSHVPLEHSSLVKFLEWNYLGGTTGQLGARDTVVNNIGSLLDADALGATVPDQ